MPEREKYPARSVDKPTEENAGTYELCPFCGRWFDCRDLEKVMAHAGPLPHPLDDSVQP
jgi:hypothetical protein